MVDRDGDDTIPNVPQSPLLNLNVSLTDAMGLGEPEEPEPQSQVHVVPWESHRCHGNKGKHLIKKYEYQIFIFHILFSRGLK